MQHSPIQHRVLDAGRIVEDGTPRDLIGTGGTYAGLHQALLESLV